MKYKILLITGNHPRHTFFADYINENYGLEALIIENKGKIKINTPRNISQHDKKNFKKYFIQRENKENLYFGKYKFPKINNLLNINSKSFNHKKVINFLKSFKINFVIVFGSSVIPKSILRILPNKIYNLHLGIVQKYRGSAPLFWPFVFFEPNYVGGSFHKVIAKVDAGNIVHQYQTKLGLNDGIHDVACKCVIDGAKSFIKLIKYSEKNKLKEYKQIKLGKNFKNIDFKPELLRIIYDLQKNKLSSMFLNKKINPSNPVLFKQF
jgi:methionyl-tRNA formyltransferase